MSANAAMWNDAAPLLTELQRLTAGGGSVVVKIDNERQDGHIFTVVVTGEKYRGRFFRRDSADLVATLRAALGFCAESPA